MLGNGYTSKVDISADGGFFEFCECGSFFPKIDNFNRYISKVGTSSGANFYEFCEFASFY